MKDLIHLVLFALLLVLGAGCERRIDEHTAVDVVRHELSLSDDLSAHKLGGGFGPSSVFLVTDGSQKYVAKFFTHPKDGTSEIYNSEIASDGGYGPKVYYADPSRGIMISEYLSGKKVSSHDLESDQFYMALAHLVQKIHRGKTFTFSRPRYDVFRRIADDMKANTSKCDDIVPISEVEHIAAALRAALLPHQTTTPCHNDLHGGNLVFFGDEFKAIDYGDAGPGDPYFDVATVTLASNAHPAHETVLLTTYLGHEPSAAEKARLYLMKQAVMVKWASDRLRALSPEDLREYNRVQAPSTDEFFYENLEGKVDVSTTKDCVTCLKVLLLQVFKNAASEEWRDAVALLSKQE